MKKTINESKIEGRLYQVNLEKKKVMNETSANYGKEFIRGSIDIAVDEDGTNVIPINFTYVAPTFPSGKENRNYNILERLMETENVWMKNGKDDAMMLRATPALGLNDWFDQNGDLVSNLRCDGGFLNIIKELGPEDERNTFKADMLINGIQDVISEDGNTEDYIKVNGAIFAYNGAILPVSFSMRNPAGMDYVRGLQLPYFVEVFGKINNLTVTRQDTVETAFGSPIVTTKTFKSRDFMIENMAIEPYDFGNPEILTAEEVQKALEDRKVMLAEQKKKSEEYRAKKKNSSSAQTTPQIFQPTDPATPKFDLNSF